VPFTSTWHPIAVAWGIASFYLLLAIELTSLARRWVSRRLWRRVHFASFALFVVSTIHVLSAGTDTGSGAFTLAGAGDVRPRGRAHRPSPRPMVAAGRTLRRIRLGKVATR
jgi:hypothetical protein